jgi:hypothetical protein
MCSVTDPDPGSGIRCLFDHWIRIRDEQPGLFSESLKNNFLGLKKLVFFDLNPGTGMEKIEKLGSGMEKSRILDTGSGINIPDPQLWQAENPCSEVVVYGSGRVGICFLQNLNPQFLQPRGLDHALNQILYQFKRTLITENDSLNFPY